MFDKFHKIVKQVDNSIGGEILAIIDLPNREGCDPAAFVAWQRPRGDGYTYGSHQAVCRYDGTVILMFGHYDLSSAKDAINRAHERYLIDTATI